MIYSRFFFSACAVLLVYFMCKKHSYIIIKKNFKSISSTVKDVYILLHKFNELFI